MARLQSSGKLTFLRVHELGTKFGPATDQIDVEVVVGLDSETGKAFGFQLRRDNNAPDHRVMLDLLRGAFNNNGTDLFFKFVRTNRSSQHRSEAA